MTLIGALVTVGAFLLQFFLTGVVAVGAIVIVIGSWLHKPK